MKLLSYSTTWGGGSIGALAGEDTVADLPLLSARFRPGEPFPSTMIGLIVQWPRLRPVLEEMLAEAPKLKEAQEGAGCFLPEGEVRYLPPIPYPPKNVNCQGVNYHEHGQEGIGAKTLARDSVYVDHPVLFSKPHTTLLPHRGGIIHHRATEALDYEGELTVVIGRGGSTSRRKTSTTTFSATRTATTRPRAIASACTRGRRENPWTHTVRWAPTSCRRNTSATR